MKKHLKYIITSFLIAVSFLLTTACNGGFNFNFDLSSCGQKDITVNTPTYDPNGNEIYVAELLFKIEPYGSGYMPKIEAIVETQGLPKNLILKIQTNTHTLTPIKRDVNVIANQFKYTILEDVTDIKSLKKGSAVCEIVAVFDSYEQILISKEVIIDDDYTLMYGLDKDGNRITIFDKESAWSNYY